MARSASAIPSPLLPIFSNTKQGFFYNEVLLKNILSLTLTLGCKNKKRSSGPIELDLEAGNLVLCLFLVPLCPSFGIGFKLQFAWEPLVLPIYLTLSSAFLPFHGFCFYHETLLWLPPISYH